MHKLLPLPAPDGAPFGCTVDEPLNKPPFVERCKNLGVGMLLSEDYAAVKDHFHLGGFVVCQEHADAISDWLDK